MEGSNADNGNSETNKDSKTQKEPNWHVSSCNFMQLILGQDINKCNENTDNNSDPPWSEEDHAYLTMSRPLIERESTNSTKWDATDWRGTIVSTMLYCGYGRQQFEAHSDNDMN